MATLDANLRRAVLAYLKRSGLSGMQFGQLALGNPGFVLGLDRDRSLTVENADRVLRFMARAPIGPMFRREVEAFLGVTGTGEANLGLKAAEDAAFVEKLRQGTPYAADHGSTGADVDARYGERSGTRVHRADTGRQRGGCARPRPGPGRARRACRERGVATRTATRGFPGGTSRRSSPRARRRPSSRCPRERWTATVLPAKGRRSAGSGRGSPMPMRAPISKNGPRRDAGDDLRTHARGLSCRVYEAAPEFRPLGVGINMLPHAIRELTALGLQPALESYGVEAREFAYFNRHGQAVFAEPCGRFAGYEYPHFSIHRADLHKVLAEAVASRLGPDAVRLGHRCIGVEQGAGGARALFEDAEPASGTIVVGADGFHSAVRRQFHPEEGAPHFGGINMWRGVTRRKPFLTGASVTRVGTVARGKMVIYPIRRFEDGSQLVNWVTEQPPTTTSPTIGRRRDGWTISSRRSPTGNSTGSTFRS